MLAVFASLVSVALVSWPLVGAGLSVGAGAVVVASLAARGDPRLITSVALLCSLAVLGVDALLVLASH